MYINTFKFGGGGHMGFLIFEAFAAIFLAVAGHTEQLGSAPLNTPKKIVCANITRFAFRTLNKHIFFTNPA